MIRSRYRKITSFFARVLLGLVWWELVLPRIGFSRWSRETRPERLRSIAERFRHLAVEMGGVLIKVGQFLSARLDVLPHEITEVLAGLQDEVPPEEFSAVRAVVESEFAAPLEERFLVFDEEPLAAASLGQVHLAQLRTETSSSEGAKQVVVKVQRPDIEAVIQTDLAALRRVGQWVHRYPPVRRRADVPALMDEFARILMEEIDYLKEGSNAETFARIFESFPDVRVPEVFWSHTTTRVLTLEDVRGIKITDYQAVTDAGIPRSELAVRLFNLYLKQIFEENFFHADPHPGNLFVGRQAGSEDRWQITFVDFGMVGRIKPEMREGMREMVIAVGTRDAARMVRSFQLLGFLLPEADLDLLERVDAMGFERFWGQNMTQLTQISLQELSQTAFQFRELLYTMPFQVPEDLILLGRTVGILSGICTGLDPEFNVWYLLAPYARKLVQEGPGGGKETAAKMLEGWLRKFIILPGRAEAVISKFEQGELEVKDPQLAKHASRLERALGRLTGGLIFAALFLGGVQLFLADYSPVGEIVLGLSGVVLLWLGLSGVIRGRR